MTNTTQEEKIQKILDLRQRVIDPDQEDPSPEEIYEAVQMLHATRGTAAQVKKATTPTVDLMSFFNDTTGKVDLPGETK
jgi:hypothetical protein